MAILCQYCLNPIQDGLFRDCPRMGEPLLAPLPKICHTYPKTMKLGTVITYLRQTQKYINHETHPLGSADNKYRYRLDFNTWFLILLTFLESWIIVLIEMFTILMMSAKMDTPGLLKKRNFEKKVMPSWFQSMTSTTNFYHVIQIILQKWSCDQSLGTVAFLWEKLS